MNGYALLQASLFKSMIVKHMSVHTVYWVTGWISSHHIALNIRWFVHIKWVCRVCFLPVPLYWAIGKSASKIQQFPQILNIDFHVMNALANDRVFHPHLINIRWHTSTLPSTNALGTWVIVCINMPMKFCMCTDDVHLRTHPYRRFSRWNYSCTRMHFELPRCTSFEITYFNLKFRWKFSDAVILYGTFEVCAK